MIIMVGDIHGELEFYKIERLKNILTKDDFVIVCGDFGCIWNGGTRDECLLNELEGYPFTTLFVDGNHENFELLYTYPIINKFKGRCRKINNHVFHLMRGEIYEIENKKIFTFGGGLSIDKANRVEGESWWPEEIPTESEAEYAIKNLEKHNYDIDIVVTHSAPTGVIEEAMSYFMLRPSPIDEYLDEIENALSQHNVDYKWYFGHFHEDMTYDNQYFGLYEDYKEVKE